MMRLVQRLRKRGGESGLTLVELAIAMGIFGVLFAAVLSQLDTATKTQAGTQARAEKLDELRGALDRIGKEVRQSLTIDTASTRSRLSMRTLVNGVEWDVVFEVASGTLTRAAKPKTQTSFGQSTVIAETITSSAIFCYDALSAGTCLAPVPATVQPSTLTIELVGHPRAPASGELLIKVEIQRRNFRSD